MYAAVAVGNKQGEIRFTVAEGKSWNSSDRRWNVGIQ